MSRRAASQKARETLKEGLRQAKKEDEEDGTGDIEYEDSEDEFVPKKKEKKRLRIADDDSDSDDAGSSGRRSAKKTRKSPQTPARRPGPKSRTKVVKSEDMTPLASPQARETITKKLKKWLNPNTYCCEVCPESKSFTTNILSTLKKHLLDYHKITFENYKEVSVDSMDPQTHKCLLCSNKVDQCPDTLEGHFLNSHPETTLRTYFERKILPLLPAEFGEEPKVSEKKPHVKSEPAGAGDVEQTLQFLQEQDGPDDSHDNDDDWGVSTTTSMHLDFCKLCGESVRQTVEDIKAHYESVHVTDNDRALAKWAQKVAYVGCKMSGCSHKPSSMRDLKAHLATHDIEVSDYVTQKGAILEKVVYHACLVCQLPVLHDQGKLAKHLTDKCKKKMTLASYYKDHVVPSGGARTGGANKNNRREAAEPIDPDVQQKYVKWLYQCDWECNKCQQTFNQYCQLKFHLKSDHQASMPFMKKGMETHPLAKKPTLHECKLCNKKIQQDNEFLGPHFQKEHEMGGLEYFGKYLLDENGELIQ